MHNVLKNHIVEQKDEFNEYCLICNKVARNIGLVVLIFGLIKELYEIANPLENTL